jgi:hypothetical protein
MSNNFDVHAWKRNRLIESTFEDADLKAKKRVDILTKNILKSFPELNVSELRYAISSGFTDLAVDGLMEIESNEKEYEVQYWIYRNDDYDDDSIIVKASSEEEALEKAKNSLKGKGKNFKILKENIENPIDTITTDVPLFIRLLEYAKEDAETDMDLHNVAENAIRLSNNSDVPLTMDNYDNIVNQEGGLNSIQEELRSILEEKGYSPLLVTKENPKGETKGLDDETLKKILMQITNKLQEEKPGLWANIRAKKSRGEKPSHGNSDAFKSAVKSGKKINNQK